MRAIMKNKKALSRSEWAFTVKVPPPGSHFCNPSFIYNNLLEFSERNFKSGILLSIYSAKKRLE